MASTNLIGDTKTVIANGPSSVTTANAIAAAGPIMDYPGLTNSLLLRFQSAAVLLAKIKTDTDAGDPSLTNINAVLAALNGTSSPTATALTAIKAVYTAGPTAASQALAIAAAGPIMDYPGNTEIIIKIFKEALALLTYVLDNTDNGTDGANRTLLLGIQSTLS